MRRLVRLLPVRSVAARPRHITKEFHFLAPTFRADRFHSRPLLLRPPECADLHSDVSQTLWKQIRDARTKAQCLQLMDTKAQEFSASDLSFFWFKVSRLPGRECATVIDDTALGELTERLLPDFQSHELEKLALAFAKLNNADVQIHEALTKQFARQVLSTVDTFDTKSLSNVAWALAKLQLEDSEVLSAIAIRAVECACQFNSRDFARIVWAYSSLRAYQHNEALFATLAEGIEAKASTLHAEHLAGIAWSYAKLGNQRHLPLFAKLGEQVLSQFSQFSPRELANIAWAFAKMGMCHEALFDRIATRIIQVTPHLNSKDTTQLVWAFATLGLYHPRLLSALAQRVMSSIDGFNQQELANTAWAFAKLEVKGFPELFESIGERCVVARDCPAPALVQVLWAFAKLDLRGHSNLLRRLTDRISNKLTECSSQELANIAWACSQLRLEERYQVFRRMEPLIRNTECDPKAVLQIAQTFAEAGVRSKAVLESIDQCGPENFTIVDLFSIVSACNRVSLRVPEAILCRVANVVTASASQCSSQELVDIAWAFSKATAQFRTFQFPELFSVISNEVMLDVGRFQPQMCARLAHCFFDLNLRDERLFAAITAKVRDDPAAFSSHDLVSVARALAKLAMHQFLDVHEIICQQACARIGEFSPQQFRKLLWSCAKLAAPHGAMLGHHTEVLLRGIERCSTLELANLVWAFAKLRLANYGDLLDIISDRSLQVDSEALAQLAWGFVQLGQDSHRRQCAQLLGAFAQQIEDAPFAFNPRQVAMIATAFSKVHQEVGFGYEQTFTLLARNVSRSLADFKPRDLATVSRALSTVPFADKEELYVDLAFHLRSHIDSFSPAAVVMMLGAFAKMGYAEAGLWTDAAKFLQDKLHHLWPPSLADVADSICTVEGCDLSGLFRALVADVLGRTDPTIVDVSRIGRAIAQRDLDGANSLVPVLLSSVDQVKSLSRSDMRVVGESTFLWRDLALQKEQDPSSSQVHHACTAVFDEIGARLPLEMRSMSPLQLHEVCVWMARMRFRHPDCLAQLDLIALDDMSQSEMVDLAWALAVLDVRWTASLEDLCHELSLHLNDLLHRLPDNDLVVAAWALCILDLVTPTLHDALGARFGGEPGTLSQRRGLSERLGDWQSLLCGAALIPHDAIHPREPVSEASSFRHDLCQRLAAVAGQHCDLNTCCPKTQFPIDLAFDQASVEHSQSVT